MDPKDSFPRKQARKRVPGYCFILRPFELGRDYDRGWDAIRAEPLKDFLCKDAKDLVTSGPIMEQIFREIARADVVIVDLTGGNPNVFYELGIAHMVKGAGKVVLLKQKSSNVPFDVQGYRFIPYEPTADGLRDLYPRLEKAVREVAEETSWFPLAEGQRHSSAVLRGLDKSFYSFDVHAAALASDAVKVELTVRSHDPDAAGKQDLRQKLTIPSGESRPIPKLPLRLKFEHVEKCDGQDKALFCVIPRQTTRGKTRFPSA